MAFMKYGHAIVPTVNVAPEKWLEKKVPTGRIKVARDVIARYEPGKWLLSHATIIASVDVDLVDSSNPKSNYYIKPQHSQFVNNNGDSWERELLRATYKSFIGADNFVEHVQLAPLSKGKIIDAALREVPIGQDEEGRPLTTLYVDILVATNRKHKDLIYKISNGEYNAMSMGCQIAFSICSRCGNKAVDEPDLCDCIKYAKRNFFYDNNGVRRIIAELCGEASDPESNKFVDGSWVRKPAFGGAVLRNIVEPGEDISEKLQKAFLVPVFEKQPGQMLRAASTEASTLMREIYAQEDKKEESPAEESPPDDDTDFPPPPEEGEGESLDLDQPDKTEDDSGDESPPAPAAEEPAAPEPKVEEPDEDATVKEVMDLLQRQTLNKIRRKLLKDEAKYRTDLEDRPTGLENDSRESLVRDASDSELIRKARKTGNDRLVNIFSILGNLKDWNRVSKYGYTKRDVLGFLYFVDKNIREDYVGEDAVKAMSNMKLSSVDPKSFFTDIIIETGRRPTVSEGRRMLKWASILSKIK